MNRICYDVNVSVRNRTWYVVLTSIIDSKNIDMYDHSRMIDTIRLSINSAVYSEVYEIINKS